MTNPEHREPRIYRATVNGLICELRLPDHAQSRPFDVAGCCKPPIPPPLEHASHAASARQVPRTFIDTGVSVAFDYVNDAPDEASVQ